MQENLLDEVENNPLEKAVSYQVQDRTFIVEPIFLKSGGETLGDALLRLMKADLAQS